MLIGVGNVGSNGHVERVPAAMNPTPQLFLRQQSEPALHQVQPGGTRRREVPMEAGGFAGSRISPTTIPRTVPELTT
jgi:hypothetical protein